MKKAAKKKTATKKTTVRRTSKSSGKMMSVILKEMAVQILVDPEAAGEANCFALFLGNIAWNRAIGVPEPKKYLKKEIAEAKRAEPNLWSFFVSSDAETLIDMLIEYKREHYPDDERYIAGVDVAQDDRYKEGGRIRVASICKEQLRDFLAMSPMMQYALIHSQMGGGPSK